MLPIQGVDILAVEIGIEAMLLALVIPNRHNGMSARSLINKLLSNSVTGRRDQRQTGGLAHVIGG